MIKYINLKVSPEIRERLNKLRGKKTYSEIMDEILTFIEVTGINPRIDRTPPVDTFVKEIEKHSSALNKRLESIVKIIRNIENTKIDPIFHGMGAKQQPATKDYEPELSVKEQEIFQIIQINKNLKEQIQLMREEEENVLNELSEARKKSATIVQIVEKYLQSEDLVRDRMGNVTLNEIFIKNLLNKINNV